MARRRGEGELVYSSGGGRMCPHCRRPRAECVCRARPRAPRGDGIVRVRREVKGRRGKSVVTISGLPLPQSELETLAAEFKRRCGAGGSVADGVIEIQGDHRDALIAELQARGYTVKRAGG